MNDTSFSDQFFSDDISLLNDQDIARFLKFSPQWVRQQRLLRRLGQKHALTIDPVMVGKKPRYDRDKFARWFEQLKAGEPPADTAIETD